MLMYIFSSQMAVFEDGPYRNGVFEAPKGEIKSSITVLRDMFWPQGMAFLALYLIAWPGPHNSATAVHYDMQTTNLENYR